MCYRNLWPHAAFRMRKHQASRRMIFSPPLPPKKKGEGALSSLRAATATHFSLPPTAPSSSTPSAPAKWHVSVPPRFARYGVDPKQVPDFIALRGDPSDKVPGAPGVGATGAATLLQKYGSLEAALAAGRFPAMADSLRLYRSIATMNKRAPPSLRNQTLTWHKAAALARDWELKQLAGRLEELAVG